jgi:hypothetical protein
MSIISLLGRIATLLLVAIFIEGMVTFGDAFDFKNYSAIGVIFQSLLFCVCIWLGAEWYTEDSKQ